MMMDTDIKVGDRLNRMFGNGEFWMEMIVIDLVDANIICVPSAAPSFPDKWTFDRATGAEVDVGLEWGPDFGKTGSYLKPKETREL